MEIGFIKCHGSGNEFIMINPIGYDISDIRFDVLSSRACDRQSGIGADGLLVLTLDNSGTYGMRMFNPDGSEAEMCGNGIRCIARMVSEISGSDEFYLISGGTTYKLSRTDDIWPSIPTFGVQIPVKLWSDDFRMQNQGDKFLRQPIPELDDNLRFTAINVGNPHIVADVECIDYSLLKRLGNRVTALPHIFPHGVNVSLVELRGENTIFVATFERGAGITSSCGTAMTSSATAMALSGRCRFDERINVLNGGGAVRCICSNERGLSTTLIGNASYISKGRIEICNSEFMFAVEEVYQNEQIAYNNYLKTLSIGHESI